MATKLDNDAIHLFTVIHTNLKKMNEKKKEHLLAAGTSSLLSPYISFHQLTFLPHHLPTTTTPPLHLPTAHTSVIFHCRLPFSLYFSFPQYLSLPPTYIAPYHLPSATAPPPRHIPSSARILGPSLLFSLSIVNCLGNME